MRLSKKLKVGDFVCGWEPIIRGIIIGEPDLRTSDVKEFNVAWLINWDAVNIEREDALLNCLTRANEAGLMG
jgi:hypothetical protein